MWCILDLEQFQKIMAPGGPYEGALKAKQEGLVKTFQDAAKRVDKEGMYDYFYEHGWNLKLSSWIRNDLAPEMLKLVTIAWYLALSEAGMSAKPKKSAKKRQKT